MTKHFGYLWIFGGTEKKLDFGRRVEWTVGYSEVINLKLFQKISLYVLIVVDNYKNIVLSE